MVQKYPAKKKVWGSKDDDDEIAFLLVITVQHVTYTLWALLVSAKVGAQRETRRQTVR